MDSGIFSLKFRSCFASRVSRPLVIIGLLSAVLSAFSLTAAEIPWRVPKYTLTAREMPVRQVLDTFGVAEGIPVVSSEAVAGVFSGDYRDVPAGEFLDRIATVHNLIWYYDGASIFVYGGSEVQTILLDLRYMKAGEVRALLKELGVEDARFPIKTASNDEMIMVSGPPRYVALVAEMIARADKLREQRTFTEVTTRVFPLKYTWADNVSFSASSSGESSQTIKGVADILRELMSSSVDSTFVEGTNGTAKSASGASYSPVIRAENRLNAVVVRDVASRMPLYADLISELDRPQKLVEIGVTVLEMSKDDALDWQASLKVTFEDQRNDAFAGQNLNSLTETASEAALAGLTGGYSYLGDHVNVSASLHALKSKGKARSIFRTSLLTLDNMMASVSDTESYSTKLVGEKVASVSETSAGTRLSIKPRVVDPPANATNAVRQVWLTMELQDGGLDMLTTVDSLPTKRTTTLDTQASLPEEHSLLLAGYFRDVVEESGWGIPFLRELPWIGWIFGGASKVTTTVQRMFILTPHVVDVAYYDATTQDVSTVQMLRQRDVVSEVELEDAAHKKDWYRKNREAEVRERRDIREESLQEKYDRDEKERDLRKDQRKDARKKDRKAWDEGFEKRKEAWEKSSNR